MSGYIARAACRGRRPSAFTTLLVRERPRLLRSLLKERGVARFIVAPDGYGKTALALSYAETMTAWTHTFWLNAQSPCFLRDLDQGVISSSCLNLDPEAALVVFDDLPMLDPDRARRFSQVIDVLIDHGCEVVVTSVPMCDTVGALQIDRVKIAGRDLLLDDEELDGTRSSDERRRVPAESVGVAARVPGLAWSPGEEGAESFVRATLKEDVPPDLMLALVSALVLCEGSLADLQGVCPSCKDAIAEVAEDYPHLGFDGDLDRFEASSVPASALALPVKRMMPELVAWSAHDSADQLVKAWASILLEGNRPGRACEVLEELCPRRAQAGWLISNIYQLVRLGCFFPVYRLAIERDCQKGAVRMRLAAIESLCLRVLGDGEGAVKQARVRAFDCDAPQDVRTLSALIVARYGSGADVRRAFETLAAEAGSPGQAPVPAPGSEGGFPWPLLAKAACAYAEDAGALLSFWHDLRTSGADDAVLCISASWLFALLGDSLDASGIQAARTASFLECEDFVRERLDRERASDSDYFVASAGLSLEEAHRRGFRSGGGPLPANVLMGLRRVEMRVIEQRQALAEFQRVRAARRGDWLSSHPEHLSARMDTPTVLARQSQPIPQLELKVFGAFEATKGGVPVSNRHFRGKNVRLLLALLAVNQGREITRDALATSMWPNSAKDVARKNFYSVWSSLRRSLALPDETCPYLLRHQLGCSLDMRHVRSDIDRFNEICRELLFGVPNYERWTLLFSEIDRDFSNEFMPTELKNGLVVRARNEFRSRLVDALVGAAFSIVDTENPQWATWFARSALQHDETREDAYVALMRAQIASNQRTAAMMTYLRCRRVLSERLGIDPSAETTRLYEGLLGDA